MRLTFPPGPELAARLAGSPLLILLDLDGTLAPIAPRPDDAEVPPDTRRLLEQLVASPDQHIAIVTGRSARDARRVLPIDGLWMIGNHGLEVVAPDGELTVDPQVAPFRPVLSRVARALESSLADIPGAMVEDKVWSLSVHYRLVDPSAVPRIQREVETLALENALRMTEGKRIFEVRAPIRVDKGTAVSKLAQQVGALGDHASLLFAGDDVTDEDAFRVLRDCAPRAVTVRVIGDEQRPTAAEFTVADTDAMRELLAWLASIRR